MSREEMSYTEIRYIPPRSHAVPSVSDAETYPLDADSDSEILEQRTEIVREPHFVNLNEPITELLPALSAFISASASVLSSGYNNIAAPIIQRANDLVEQSRPLASESIENLKDSEFMKNLNQKLEGLHHQLVSSIENIKQTSLSPGALFSSGPTVRSQQEAGQSNEEAGAGTIGGTRQKRAISLEEARHKIPLYRTDEDIARDEALKRKSNKEEWPSATHAVRVALEKLNDATDKVIDGLPESIREKIRNHKPRAHSSTAPVVSTTTSTKTASKVTPPISTTTSSKGTPLTGTTTTTTDKIRRE